MPKTIEQIAEKLYADCFYACDESESLGVIARALRSYRESVAVMLETYAAESKAKSEEPPDHPADWLKHALRAQNFTDAAAAVRKHGE